MFTMLDIGERADRSILDIVAVCEENFKMTPKKITSQDNYSKFDK